MFFVLFVCLFCYTVIIFLSLTLSSLPPSKKKKIVAEASIFKQIDCNYASVCSPSLLFSLRFTGLSTIALTVPPMGEGEKGEEYEERFGKLVRSVLEKVKEGKIFKGFFLFPF